MKTEGIDIIFFGNPGKRLVSFPSNSNDFKENLQRFSNPNGTAFTNWEDSKGYHIKYIQDNVTGVNGTKGKRFGIGIFIKGYRFNIAHLGDLEEFLKNFTDNYILKKAKILDEFNTEIKHYNLTSFQKDSQNLNKCLAQLKKDFLRKFQHALYTSPSSNGMNKAISEESNNEPYRKKKRWLRILRLLTAIGMSILLFYLLYCFSEEFVQSLGNKEAIRYINWFFLGLLILYLVIFIPYKFFIDDSHAGDDNQFIAITSLIGLIALTVSVYSKALIDNGSNIGRLVVNSISQHHFTPQIDTQLHRKNETVFLCLDISGSSNTEISQDSIPDWYRDNKEELFDIFNVRSKIRKLFKEDEIKEFDLIKIKALLALTKIKDSIPIRLITFGENSIEERLEYSSKQELALDILKLENMHLTTDFELLFKKLNRLLKEDLDRDRANRDNYQIIILSDFKQDVNNDSTISYELESLFDELIRNPVGFNFILSSYNSNEQELVHLIEKKLKSKKMDFNISKEKESSRIAIKHFRSQNKLHLFYNNAYHDSTNAFVSYKLEERKITMPEDNLNVQFIFDNNNDIPSFGRFNYRIPDYREVWTPLYKGETIHYKSNRKIELNYTGTFYNQFPNLSFKLECPSDNRSYKTEIVFTKKTPYIISIILLLLVCQLVVLEVFYFLKIFGYFGIPIIFKFITKPFKH